jgi:peptidoglycan/xylan/chitin deacetylase (PgdA/CDA1 family)
MKNKFLILLLVMISILIISCNSVQEEGIDTDSKIDNKVSELSEDEPEVIDEKITEETTSAVDEVEEDDEEITNESETSEKIEIDYQKIRPNEAGRVMIIMYHSLGEKEAYYVSTPDILRQNLQDLYDRDYFLVSLKDFVNNTMDVPAGKTPVVLTFDDGHQSNFNIIEKSGELTIDPDSAVGIIDNFYEKNPDFGKAATFFLNSNISFSQVEHKAFKLNYLIENGYDLGSHSYGHEDLTALDAKGIQKTLGKNVQSIESIIKDYTVNTLALPFGKRPKEPDLEKYVFEGTYEDENYEFIAVLNVGWNPTYAPIHTDFNYKSINRVQSGSGDFQLNYWIDYFDENPDKKYISDGIMGQITVPKILEEKIDVSTIGEKELIIYERD